VAQPLQRQAGTIPRVGRAVPELRSSQAGRQRDEGLTVSVVIPTVDRPSVVDAVRSALAQDYPPIEVLVVFDREDDLIPVALPQDSRVRVLRTGRRLGGGAARALGTTEARGNLVAFLDDDDEWFPAKLRRQVVEFRRLRDLGFDPVVTCRVRIIREDGRDAGLAPRDLYSEGDDVVEYLFRRRRVRTRSFGMASSTLLCSRELLERVPWRPLRLHQDWDWVVRACREPAVVVTMIPQPLVQYLEQPPKKSTSRQPGGWDASYQWAVASGMPRPILGDFLLGITAVNAIAHGRRATALRIAYRAAVVGRPGIRAWTAFALQVSLPPKFLGATAALTQRYSSSS
jgi:hypothetical protein